LRIVNTVKTTLNASSQKISISRLLLPVDHFLDLQKLCLEMRNDVPQFATGRIVEHAPSTHCN